MNVIIAGGRDFNDYELLKRKCDAILKNVDEPITIVSGGARGADRLGQRYATENGYHLAVMNADWDKHGKRAGYIRNANMLEYADCLIAFHDGKSRGTAHMIRITEASGKPYRVIRY